MWSLLFVLVLGKGLAVHIDVVAPEPMLSLDLGCNVFEPGIANGGPGLFDRIYTGNRIGILVSKNDLPNQETKLGTINYTSPTTYNFKGGASTFPTLGLRGAYTPACSSASPPEYNVEENCSSPTVWGSPPQWTAIANQSTVNPVTYYSYRNEYLDRNNANPLVIRNILSGQATGSLATTDPIVASGNTIYELRCLNFLEFPIFPTSVVRPGAVVLGASSKTHLLNPVPNPAHGSCTIGVVMESGVGVIQIFNIVSGLIIAQQQIESPKEASATFDLSTLNKGVYGYRLLVDKMSIDTKILTVE